MSEIRVNNLSNESDSGGPTISGITTFSSPYFFVPPVGNTAQRPDNPQKGAIRFNTDSNHLEYFRGDAIGWTEVESSNEELNGGARGIFFGGYQAPAGRMNVIQYLTISTLGNTLDFGDLNDNTGRPSAAASRTRAVCLGGFQSPTVVNIIQYVTIASLGNATDFGDLTYARNQAGAASSQIRAIGGGGNPSTNAMDYITIASTGNAADFGDLSTPTKEVGMTSDSHGGLGGF